MRPVVLAIGGLDPSGGAGILADAEAIRACGGEPMCVPTALTEQTRSRVSSWTAVNATRFGSMARAIVEDEHPAAVKIGMLANGDITSRVQLVLRMSTRPLVVDPVFASSSGYALFRGNYKRAYKSLCAGAVVTPNLLEVAHLGSSPAGLLDDNAARAVLVKGGHRKGRPIDVLFTRDGEQAFEGTRLPDKRGTGCRLASAIATYLALGAELPEAVRLAREYVRGYLAG